MKKLLLVSFFLSFFFLQSCSWICRFYISNTTNEPMSVEIKLNDTPTGFPIFHYAGKYFSPRQYKLKSKDAVDFNSSVEAKIDTFENSSHYKIQIPPHAAVEIGQLQNDKYEKHDQYFINGRIFNLEKISIAEKKIEISPATFDNYFHKGKLGEVYFVL